MLLLYPLLLTAPTDPPASRWSVEAGGLHQRYAQYETLWGRGRESVYAVLPVHLRCGIRMNDGSTLYLGVQYRYRQSPLTVSQTYDNRPDYTYWQTTRAVTTLAVPFAAGLPIAPRQLGATAWRVEAQVGLTFILARYRQKQYSTHPMMPAPYELAQEKFVRTGDLPLTAGGRIGYRLSRRFELTATATASYSPLVLLGAAFGGQASPFSGSGSVGLRYQF